MALIARVRTDVTTAAHEVLGSECGKQQQRNHTIHRQLLTIERTDYGQFTKLVNGRSAATAMPSSIHSIRCFCLRSSIPGIFSGWNFMEFPNRLEFGLSSN
jgi:hypothetical protein